MTNIAMPPVDEAVIGRRDEIVAGLVAILGPDHVIATEDERRAYETDALTAYRAVPLAVVLPGTTEEVSAVLAFLNGTGRQGGRPRRRHVAGRRRAAVGGRGGPRPRPDEPDPRHRLRRTAWRGSQTGVTNLDITGAVSRAWLLLRARPVEPARLHDRRQHRDEFRRRPLPQIRRHHQQRPRRQDGAGRRHDRRHRRQRARRGGLRPARPRHRLGGPARRRHRGDACASCAPPKARGRC